MRVFTLDASECANATEFYDSLLFMLEAPYWHGTSVNALIDSMVYGGINGVEPPYTIRVTGTANLPAEIKTELGWLIEALQEHKAAENGVFVEVDSKV